MSNRILIIDGDKKDLMGISETLSENGHKNIVLAQNAKEGVKKAKTYKPKVIISAVFLSDSTGFKLCNKIKSIKGLAAKVILITGKLNRIESNWKYKSEADAFFVKSEPYECLCQAVSRFT